MPTAKNKNNKPQYNYITCTFQEGGALGACQADVLHALDEAGYYPNWFVGTQITRLRAIKLSPWHRPISATAGIAIYEMSALKTLKKEAQI